MYLPLTSQNVLVQRTAESSSFLIMQPRKPRPMRSVSELTVATCHSVDKGAGPHVLGLKSVRCHKHLPSSLQDADLPRWTRGIQGDDVQEPRGETGGGVQSLRHVRFSVTPWTTGCQASLFFSISRRRGKTILFFFRTSYFILEYPVDRGTWRATVHGIQRVGHNRATNTLKSPINNAVIGSVNREGIQPYIHVNPLSLNPRSHPGCRMALSRVPCAARQRKDHSCSLCFPTRAAEGHRAPCTPRGIPVTTATPLTLAKITK